MRFKVQPRLRSFARLITQNYNLRILFQGEQACISGNLMMIPAVELFRAGSGEAGEITNTSGSASPPGRVESMSWEWGSAAEIWKSITARPGAVLASVIACRSDPVPLSLVFVTVKV